MERARDFICYHPLAQIAFYAGIYTSEVFSYYKHCADVTMSQSKQSKNLHKILYLALINTLRRIHGILSQHCSVNIQFLIASRTMHAQISIKFFFCLLISIAFEFFVSILYTLNAKIIIFGRIFNNSLQWTDLK